MNNLSSSLSCFRCLKPWLSLSAVFLLDFFLFWKNHVGNMEGKREIFFFEEVGAGQDK